MKSYGTDRLLPLRLPIAFLLSGISTVTADQPAVVERLQAGPWGEVEMYDLVIEPPDWIVKLSRDWYAHEEPVVWKLPVDSVEAATEFLEETGLGEDWVKELLSPDRIRSTEGGVEIRPPDSVIEALSPSQRSRLYPRIDPDNRASVFSSPYHLERRGFRHMAADSGVSPETVDFVSRLTYHVRGRPMFSDICLAMKRAVDDEDRWRLMKTIRRENSLGLRLKVSASSPRLTLADYWSARGRNKDVLPILDSVAGTPGVERIDLVHLLPPTPRKLVHAFPDPFSGVGMERVDCFWTAFNFFAYDPSHRPVDDDVPRRNLEHRYERAPKPWVVGDLIIISDVETGDWIHACNYIAGDVVFTKNGLGLSKPWVFQRLDEVLRNYLWTDQITATFYRLKPQFRN